MRAVFRILTRRLSPCLLLALWGCASTPSPGPAPALALALAPATATPTATPIETPTATAQRPFRFDRDTVGFTNETRWIYSFDAQGRVSHTRREPPPTYGLRCFVVARLNRQFFDHATFEPSLPRLPADDLEDRVRQVVRRSARRPSDPTRRVVIPGYPDLRSFSLDQEALLKRLGGSAWESYLQRGHWRMVLPFGRAHQTRTAERLRSDLDQGRPRVLHLVRFPQLTLNHAVLALDARPTDTGLEFTVADPNQPGETRTLSFDRATGRFRFPPNPYFVGGRVDVYEVFRGIWY